MSVAEPESDWAHDRVAGLLGQCEALESAHGLHPIARHTALALLEANGCWAHSVGPEQEAHIIELIEAANADGSIEHAMVDLIRLAALLAREGTRGPMVDELVAIIDRAVFEHHLLARPLGPAAAFDSASRAAIHAAVGAKPDLRAPKLGALAPAGSFRVGRLITPRHRV